MGSQSLLRLTATRGAAGSAICMPERMSSPTRRLHSAVYCSNACLKSLQIRQIYPKTSNRSSISIPQRAITRTISTQPPTSSQAPNPGSAKPTRRRRPYLLALLALTTLAITINETRKSNPRLTLNKDLFTPCTVISNSPISPNAFILAIQLPPSATNDAAIAAAWRHGLWSIEVKQPQLQIARHYTPLPPPSDGFPTATAAPGTQQLQFYVRQYDGGEVSTYLSRLQAGEPIEIRGPHLGFDLGARLGPEEEEEEEQGAQSPQRRKKVLFLAGGTGVAPALQVAEYVLGRRDDVELEVLWASRSGVDCAGGQRLPVEKRSWFSSGKGPVDERYLREEPTAIVRQIRELQAAYQKEKKLLQVKCAVDEEGSMIKARDILEAVGSSSQLEELSSPSCHFHSQQQLEYSMEESDVSSGGSHDNEKTIAAPRCSCTGEGAKGKNLLIVSGPDGFVSAYVGPKVWANGGERQGPVGGVVRGLMRDKPEIWKNWLVLKQ